jgi:chitin disaccharide deacetylase
MEAVKRVVFCADDFGQGDAIDAGILRLVGRGRLTAVSCLAEGPAFERDAPALLRQGASVDVGLHVNFTDAFGAAPAVGLAALIARCYAGALDVGAAERRLEAQLERFERAVGRPPDFVDGHRHVHQLPGIRDLLLGLLARRYGGSLPFVRNTVPRSARGIKALAIACLGGRALRRTLVARRISHNRDFAGVYGLNPHAGYGRLMRGWLGHIGSGGLVLCHPGFAGDGDDPIAAARIEELRYLDSPAFEADCAAAGVVAARLADAVG